MGSHCNFVVIHGDVSYKVGDGYVFLEETFQVSDNYDGKGGILMFMVQGLTKTDKEVTVKVNEQAVGKIYPFTGANPEHWYTQLINIGQGFLKKGENEMQISAVSYDGAVVGDLFDDFAIRDIVCLYHTTD